MFIFVKNAREGPHFRKTYANNTLNKTTFF
jgi:hypothetical protein